MQIPLHILAYVHMNIPEILTHFGTCTHIPFCKVKVQHDN